MTTPEDNPIKMKDEKQQPVKVTPEIFEILTGITMIKITEPTAEQIAQWEKELKTVVTGFFFHWFNAPGQNTYQGYDEWAKAKGEPMIDKLRQAAFDEYSKQLAELKSICFHLEGGNDEQRDIIFEIIEAPSDKLLEVVAHWREAYRIKPEEKPTTAGKLTFDPNSGELIITKTPTKMSNDKDTKAAMTFNEFRKHYYGGANSHSHALYIFDTVVTPMQQELARLRAHIAPTGLEYGLTTVEQLKQEIEQLKKELHQALSVGLQNKKIAELNKRVTVLEGLLRDIQSSTADNVGFCFIYRDRITSALSGTEEKQTEKELAEGLLGLIDKAIEKEEKQKPDA